MGDAGGPCGVVEGSTNVGNTKPTSGVAAGDQVIQDDGSGNSGSEFDDDNDDA